jgi:uncharacterized OsmC-like protein
MNAKIDTAPSPALINGLDMATLGQKVEAIAGDPSLGTMSFALRTQWDGAFRMVSRVESCELGGQKLPRLFTIVADEPAALTGGDSGPNPQELLMASVASCVGVTFVATASMMGVALDKLEIETQGSLDLRGAFALDPSIVPGYERMGLTIRVAGNGTREQFQEILQETLKNSPSCWNITRPIEVSASLEVE